MFTWPAKDPDEVLEYSWDVPLDAGDAIDSRTVTLIAGDAVLGSVADANGIVTVELSGGTAGTTSVIEMVANTTEGRTHVQNFSLPINSSGDLLAVTTDELRTELRDVADPDNVLLALIEAATSYVEEATGLALVARTEVYALDGWPLEARANEEWWEGEKVGALLGNTVRAVELPYAPLLSVESVQTFDNADSATTFPASQYYVDVISRPGRLTLNSGAVWPVPTRPANGIIITYRVGHESAAQIPAPLRRAVLQIAAHWYENRELVDYDGPSRVPMQAGRIIKKFRVVKL